MLFCWSKANFDVKILLGKMTCLIQTQKLENADMGFAWGKENLMLASGPLTFKFYYETGNWIECAF